MREDGDARKEQVQRQEASNGGDNQKVALYKLFGFADRMDVGLMIVGGISAIVNGLSQPLMTLIFGQLINSFGASTNSNTVHHVSKVTAKFLYMGTGVSIAAFLQVSCWMVTGERQSARVRCLYLKSILRQDIGFFDTETKTGEVTGRISGDTVLIQEALGEKVGKFIQLLSTFIGGFIIAFGKGWRLALVLLCCMPGVILSGGIMAVLSAKMSSRGQIAYAGAGNVVEQTLGAIRTVASFAGEKHSIQKYNDKLRVAYKATVQQGLASGTGMGLTMFVIFGTYGLAIWYGAKLVMENGYNGGQVISVMFTFMTGGMALGQASPCLNAFAAGQAAAYKMFEIIKRNPKIDLNDTSGMVLEDINGEIELKDVYFSYPSRRDIQIFTGFSLQFPCGMTTALVGQSGSGKSTVISLMERFYDPDSGEVLIDGVDLKKLKLSWIREKIGLVSQELVLFATSIKENIAYGKEHATDQEIRTAIELANAAKFVDKLPKGLDTLVGDHGAQLSGGQKQRIAIARAILKNPKILLLDEATSALDAESESIVQDALMKIIGNRTIVVVAHRLTTIRNADLIAVLQMGKIVEKGTHEELIKDKEGAYSQLVHVQEGTKESEKSHSRIADYVGTHLDTDRQISRTGSLKQSCLRSSSGRSSGSRRSLTVSTLGTGMPGPIIFHEIEHDQRELVEEIEQPKEVSIRKLAYLNKPELPALLVGTIAAAIHGIIYPIFGLLLAATINTLYKPPHELIKDSRTWAIVYASVGFLDFTLLSLQSFLFGIAGGKLIERIRSMTFEKVVHQEISWFDDPANSSGAVGARLSIDASAVRNLVGDTLALIVQNMATIAAGIIIAFRANWTLALVILVVSPLLLLQGRIQLKFLEGFTADAKLMYEEASQVAKDAVGSIRTVASFCAEKKIMDLYQEKCQGSIKQGVRLGLVNGTGFGLSFFLLCSTYAFCFYIGSVLVQHGKATFEELFKVFFALNIAAVGISQSTGLGADAAKAKNSAASIFAIINRKSKIDSSSDEGIVLPYVNGNIEFEHVSFKYPTRPNVQIFKDLSLIIPSGKTVALVGESGSGKSTIISLIERFYDPESGHIYLDNVDIKKLKLIWLRQQMGLVSQEPILFNETIRANIAYGKQENATEEEIIAATKAANAHNFITSLPQGYDTCVGERGIQMSGGQKQRIAIARAILKDPKILLLDEATSALDAESEQIVQEALDTVMENRTTIIVAHRLNTVKGADLIAVVQNGEIAEKGSHDVLMKINNGPYASMVALQSIET